MRKLKIQQSFTGIYGSANTWQINRLLVQDKQILLITNEPKRIQQIYDDLYFWNPKLKIIRYPHWDSLPLEHVSPQTEITAERINTLYQLINSDFNICLTTPAAIQQKTLNKDYILKHSLKLKVGQKINREDLLKLLISGGYQANELVEHVGHFAFRGYVIDIFSASEKYPVRIELKEEQIISLNLFDYSSQRTFSEKIDKFLILPVVESLAFSSDKNLEQQAQLLTNIKNHAEKYSLSRGECQKFIDAYNNNFRIPGIELISAFQTGLVEFLDFIPENLKVILDEPYIIDQQLDQRWESLELKFKAQISEGLLTPEPKQMFLEPASIIQKLNEHEIYAFEKLELIDHSYETTNLRTQSNTELHTLHLSKNFQRSSGKILDFLKERYQAGWHLGFAVDGEHRRERILKLIADADLHIESESDCAGWIKNKKRFPIVIFAGALTQGFQLASEKIIIISESDIFQNQSKRKKQNTSSSIRRLLSEIARLTPDDLVVHQDYGIGIYNGLKNLEIAGIKGDFLDIQYADSRLYLPLQNIRRIQKYHATEGSRPLLDKLSSQRWSQTKAKVKKSVQSLAGDLIKLYATRQIQQGWRYEPYGAADEIFADDFPYSETQDQLKTIEETLNDMASDKPMDRLICGDVGFGKTEVAIRAAYKAVQHTKQVAILVPTTILVDQHLRSFQTRFQDFPVKVAGISRFFKAAENRQTLAELASGDVDIIIGTHRLLQRDVIFKDLGLLVIDEEHRFGVKQKERLKNFRQNIDVLSMTATPIPRTLHMSLSEIRDISVIATPPSDRQVIKTYIAERNNSIIRDAILRELQRAGQVFYLHNRVESIALVCQGLKDLVPEAKFRFAHGQMPEQELEKIMHDFFQNKFNVLVSTTIIESGLDVPNANTMIIDRADTLGLAQLYQLRGRVGRSNQQAYTYLLINDLKKISATARRRLEVLQDLDNLGQGFSLALQDLEIRGTGNMLGKEQSGHVFAVGYELYSKILQEAIMNLRGKQLANQDIVDPEIKVKIAAYIPEHYIPDVSQRLVVYQRLASAINPNEIIDMQAELIDRFGPLDPECFNLLDLMKIRTLLKKLGVEQADITEKKLVLYFSPNAELNPEHVLSLRKRYKLKIRPNNILIFEISSCNNEELTDIYDFVAKLIDDLHLS